MRKGKVKYTGQVPIMIKDGTKKVLEYDVWSKSPIISGMVDDSDFTKPNESIPLVRVSSRGLDIVVQYITRMADGTLSKDKVQAWIAEWSGSDERAAPDELSDELTDDLLFDVMDMTEDLSFSPDLLEELIVYMAHIITNETSENLKVRFNIKDEPVVDLKFIKDNEWIDPTHELQKALEAVG